MIVYIAFGLAFGPLSPTHKMEVYELEPTVHTSLVKCREAVAEAVKVFNEHPDWDVQARCVASTIE